VTDACLRWTSSQHDEDSESEDEDDDQWEADVSFWAEHVLVMPSRTSRPI